MNNVNPLNTVFLAIIAFTLLSCSEKVISPEVVPQPEIGVAIEGISEADARQEKYELGIEAMSVRDFSAARRIFSEFIRENPQMAGAYANLALIHFENQEYDQALKLVERAIGLNNRQSQAYNLRAQLLIFSGEVLDARDDYLKAIELNPQYTNAQYNLALLYDLYLQDVKLALQHYEIYMSLISQPDETTQSWIGHLKRTLNNG
jgi:tetratricopeptide (TPR) repeat protein